MYTRRFKYFIDYDYAKIFFKIRGVTLHAGGGAIQALLITYTVQTHK